MRFDAYSHCGRSKYAPWPQVASTHKAASVTGGLLVQHLGEFDNSYLIESARRLGPLYRVAALVDADAPTLSDAVARLAVNPTVVAVRVMTDRESGWARTVEAAALSGLDVVYVCPSGLTPVGPRMRALAADLPTIRHVIAHFGAVRGITLDNAHIRALLALAELPNTVAMASGFSMHWEYPYADAIALVTKIASEYGVDRLIWGSNYPVRLTAAEYVRNLEFFDADPWALGAESLNKVLYGNAVRMWCSIGQHA